MGQNTPTCVTRKSLGFFDVCSINDIERREFPLHSISQSNNHLKCFSAMHVSNVKHRHPKSLIFHRSIHDLYYWLNPSLTKHIPSSRKMLSSHLSIPSSCVSSLCLLNTSWSDWTGTKCPACTVWVGTALRKQFPLRSSQQMALAGLQVQTAKTPGALFFTDFWSAKWRSLSF